MSDSEETTRQKLNRLIREFQRTPAPAIDQEKVRNLDMRESYKRIDELLEKLKKEEVEK